MGMKSRLESEIASGSGHAAGCGCRGKQNAIANPVASNPNASPSFAS